MTRLFPVTICLAACVVSAAALQQVAPQPVPLFRSRVDLVVLDVSVLDSERRPVRGLTAGDFSIAENGQPQTIAMFSAIDLPDPPPPTAPWLREVAPDVRRNEDDARGQLVVLLLDDANPMSLDDANHAKAYGRSVISQLGPNDLGAVAFVADARSGQEFTRDRSRLLAAVDRFGSPGAGGALSLLGPRYTLFSLIGQAETMGDVSTRRKVVIFISARGSAVPESVAGEVRDAVVGQDAPGAVEAPGLAAGMKADALGDFGRFVRAAQQANVAVYCVDPGGLRAPETRSNPNVGGASSFYVHSPNVTGIESLKALSANTGAFAIVETNDPEAGLARAFRENRSYYLLAYASTDSRTDGRYRRITVRVNRPGVMVRTRSGYFEPTAKEARRAPAQPTTAAALAHAIANADIPLEIAAAPFGIANRPEAAVAVVVHVKQPASAASGGLDVDVRAVDYLAKQRASERVPVTIGVRPDAEFDVEYEVLSRLELTPGRYQLRVAAVEHARTGAAGARAATAGRAGSVFCDLDVPDFGRAPLSLSGLVVSRAPGSLVAPKDRLAATIPVVPTTARVFRPEDRTHVFLRVYEGGGEPVTPVELRVRVIDAQNTTVVDQADMIRPERFTTGRSADFQWAIPIERLAIGEYLLSIEARRGKTVDSRTVRFAVTASPTTDRAIQ